MKLYFIYLININVDVIIIIKMYSLENQFIIQIVVKREQHFIRNMNNMDFNNINFDVIMIIKMYSLENQFII